MFFKKRLLESAQLAFRKEIPVYTDFLGLAEQNLFLSSLRELPAVAYSIYGGTSETERFCICFDGRENVNGLKQIKPEHPLEFPISCVKITPSGSKYTEPLTHRDFLGAILHLGITRAKVGDIRIKEQTAYVFCTASIVLYVASIA